MPSLQLMLPIVAGLTMVLWGFPTLAGTPTQHTGNPTPPDSAKLLGGTLSLTKTIFPQVGDPTTTPVPTLQGLGKRPFVKSSNSDPWESELLDVQRRSEPGFLTIPID